MIETSFAGRVVKDATLRTIGKRDYYVFRAVHNNGRDKEGTFVNINYPKFGDRDISDIYVRGAVVAASGRLEATVYNGHADLTIWATILEVVKFADKGNNNDNDLPADDAF